MAATMTMMAAMKGEPIDVPSQDGGSGIFPFFQLPRELRDEIYEHALEFKCKLPSQHRARLRVRRRARLNLLLISRRFRDEYAAHAQRRTTLIIVDRDEFLGQTLSIPSPALTPAVTRLEVHLALACSDVCHGHAEGCRVKRELRMHRRWIADVVAQMRGLESIVLKVLLDPHDYVAQCEMLLETEQFRLTGLEELAEMHVFHCEYETCDAGWNFMKRRVQVMSWDARHARLTRLPVAQGQDEAEEAESPTTAVAASSTVKAL